MDRRDARIAELEGCLRAMLAAVKTVPEMNHTRFDSLGVRINAALAPKKPDTAPPWNGPTNFDGWWQADGKYYDPDTEDVDWYDKREELAAYAYRAGVEFDTAPEHSTTLEINLNRSIARVKSALSAITE